LDSQAGVAAFGRALLGALAQETSRACRTSKKKARFRTER
jgi:hypothetical protein